MALIRRSGHINFLRVHDRGGFGDSRTDDFLSEEVVAGISSEPEHRFGLALQEGDEKLQARRAMFDLLRAGLINDVETTVDYDIDLDAGHKLGLVAPVELRRPDHGRSPIGWQPSILRPVFFGHRVFAKDEGPEVALRIFFPSLDGSPTHAEILSPRMPYPLVVFLHGNCNEEGHYLKWERLPATLAMAGYVVAVPDLPAVRGGMRPTDDTYPDVDRVTKTVAWLRSNWEHADLLAGESQTAVVGHSRGVLLAAFLRSRLSPSAIVSLSGAWTEISLDLWDDIGVPVLYMWGSGSFIDEVQSALDSHWKNIPAPKYSAVFDGAGHWDYLPAGSTTRCEERTDSGRGPCALVEALAADLTALFLARHLPPADSEVAWTDPIPPSLDPPEVSLTDEQTFFAGGHHLGGLRAVARDDDCRVELQWDTRESVGGRTLS